MDRSLGAGRPRVLGADGQADREPESVDLDLRRTHRVLDVDGLVGSRALHDAGVRGRSGRKVLPGRAARAGRLAGPDPLHHGACPVRRTQLDHRQRAASAPADGPGHHGHGARYLLHHVPHGCGAGGSGRWQLRLVHGQRRRREHRSGRGADARLAGDRHRRHRQSATGAGHLRADDRDRRGVRRAVHGQHLLGAGRHRRAARSDPGPSDLDHVVPLHRHLRLVHRLQLRLRPRAADSVRPHPTAGGVGGLHRTAR